MKKTYIAIRDIKFPKFSINIKAGETFQLDEKQFAEVAHFGYGKWFDFTKEDKKKFVPSKTDIKEEKERIESANSKPETKIAEDITEEKALIKLKKQYKAIEDKRSMEGRKIKAEIKRLEG